MKVLILSKTNMGSICCIGGMKLNNGNYVRLLSPTGYGQPCDKYQINDVWDIEYNLPNKSVPPHVEDIYITKATFLEHLEDISVKDFIKKYNTVIWEGAADNIFDGCIKWTDNGTGYIDKDNIPKNSVGFWISDRNITRQDYQGVRYSYLNIKGRRNFKYVGTQEPIQMIPKGTLLRVSLARWWSSNIDDDKKCFLQLSGWYNIT